MPHVLGKLPKSTIKKHTNNPSYSFILQVTHYYGCNFLTAIKLNSFSVVITYKIFFILGYSLIGVVCTLEIDCFFDRSPTKSLMDSLLEFGSRWSYIHLAFQHFVGETPMQTKFSMLQACKHWKNMRNKTISTQYSWPAKNSLCIVSLLTNLESIA